MAKHMKTIIRRSSERFVEWCADDSAAARLERTIAQGIIGIVAGVVASAITGAGVAGTITAPIAMAIISPIQSFIGSSLKE